MIGVARRAIAAVKKAALAVKSAIRRAAPEVSPYRGIPAYARKTRTPPGTPTMFRSRPWHLKMGRRFRRAQRGA